MGKEMALLGVIKKKVSEDKVSKHESNHKKHKRHNVKAEDSDDESSKDSIEQEGGASLTQNDDEKTACNETMAKKEKKRLKKEKRLREEALKQLMANELGHSPTASGSHLVEATEHEDKKKEDNQPAQQSKPAGEAEEAGVDVEETPGPSAVNEDIFMIDVNPTPANREKLRAQSEDEDMEDGGALLPERQPGHTAAPSGRNRLLRRRQQMIDREKARIQKKLGVKEGSDEHAQEVQQQLSEFIKTYDAKAEKREVKKNERKRKEAIRQRCRRGAGPRPRK